MATRKLLRLDEVDLISFVDKGDNPKAHITLAKRAVEKAQTKTEGGEDYPAAAFAYVPDPEKPSTWKLRLWASPSEKETAAQVGRAVAALGEGFRGNRVEIPSGDLAGVKSRVRAAWRKTHGEGDEMPDVIKSQEKSWLARQFLKFIGDPENAQTFAEVGRYENAWEDIWNLTNKLGDSLRSIISDEDVEDKSPMISQSLTEFTEAVNRAVPVWLAGGSVTKTEEDHMATNTNILDGFDLDALDPKVQEAFKALTERITGLEEELEKASAVTDPPADPPAEGGEDVIEGVMKALRDAITPDEGEEEVDPKIAGLIKTVESRIEKAEAEAKAKDEAVEALQKQLSEIEKRERRQRFIKMAADLDQLPETTSDDFGEILDKAEAALSTEEFERLEKVLKGANEAAKQAGLFNEVGANGDGDGTGAAAELAKRAKSLREADPKLSESQARDQVLERDPELANRVLDEEEQSWHE